MPPTYIAFGLENRRIPQEKMKDIIIQAAKSVEVDKLLSLESQKLSGGTIKTIRVKLRSCVTLCHRIRQQIDLV